MQNVTASTPVKPGYFDGLVKFLQFQPPKPKPEVVVNFCKQLSSFVRVGIPVTAAMQAFAEQTPSKRLRKTSPLSPIWSVAYVSARPLQPIRASFHHLLLTWSGRQR